MRTNVEVRVSIVHEIDPYENELIAHALQRDLEASDISAFDRAKLCEIIDGLGDGAHEANVKQDAILQFMEQRESRAANGSRKS